MDTNNSFYPIDSLSEHLAAASLILTPNQRLARRIKHAWGLRQFELGRAAWRTPDVMSLEQWWLTCYRAQRTAGETLPGLPTRTQQRALWFRTIESSEVPALLRPASAVEQAAQAYHDLELWEIDWESGAVAAHFLAGEDTGLFLTWARAYLRELRSLGLATLPSLVPALAERCPRERVILAEFDEVPPLYLRSLERQASELLIHRAPARHSRCRLQPCDSHRGELEAAARWARDRFNANPSQRIGLVLPGLQGERCDIERILHREFDSDPRRPESLPVNFSAGTALSDCAPVRAALTLLSLPLRELSLNGFGQVLYSRFRDTTHLAQEEEAWHWLLREAREPLTPTMLRHALGRVTPGQGDVAVLQRFLLESGQTRVLRERRRASAWPAQFMRLLDRLGWPGPEPLDSLEHQQVAQFYDALHMLGELEPLEGAIDHGRALVALEQICADCVFQAQTPDAPIQVLGLLEAAGLQFDAMWICGVSASEWPAPLAPNPFIPLQVQRAAGMPHADARRELEYASRLLQRLRHSSADIVASYARLDDEITVPPSPLLDDFDSLEAWREAPWPAQWPAGERVDLEVARETPAPPVDPQEASEITGGSAILADQAQCPFRAFARHRLGARPLPSPEPALTAAQRGTLLHDALFHLWGELENSDKLKALDGEGRMALSARSAGAAVEQFRRRGGKAFQAALLDIEARRLTQLLRKWLDIESERADFVVADRERDHDLVMGGLTLTLRVDRVDTLANGRRLLIDYKSGDVKPRLWLGERPEEPQLPLYTRLLDADEVEGVSFAVLRHAEQEYRGIARSPQGPGIETDLGKATGKTTLAIKEWDALQSHWNERLEVLVSEFVEGHATVAPLNRNTTCAHCGLEALCRVR